MKAACSQAVFEVLGLKDRENLPTQIAALHDILSIIKKMDLKEKIHNLISEVDLNLAPTVSGTNHALNIKTLSHMKPS